jgi:hypothetical protein
MNLSALCALASAACLAHVCIYILLLYSKFFPAAQFFFQPAAKTELAHRQTTTRGKNKQGREKSTSPRANGLMPFDSRVEVSLSALCATLCPKQAGGAVYPVASRPVRRTVLGRRCVRLKRTNLQSKGLVSIDRSVVAALLSTTPRPRARSSTNDFTPPHCMGWISFGRPADVMLNVRAGPVAVA